MITAAQRNAILARLTSAGGPYDPAAMFLGLTIAIDNKGLDTTLADITVPEGDLGDRQAVTPLGTAHTLQGGLVARDGPLLAFRPADETEAATVNGWYLATAAVAGSLLAFGTFGQSYGLINADSLLSVMFRVVVDPNGEWDSTVAVNG